MTDFPKEPVSMYDVSRQFEERKSARMIERIRDVNADCLSLADVLSEIAIREANLPSSKDASQVEMLKLAKDIVHTVGLERYVTVHDYRYDTRDEVVARVKLARDEAGLSQTEFGETTGLGSRFAVSRIEQGEIDFTGEQVERIYDAIGVDRFALTPETRVDG